MILAVAAGVALGAAAQVNRGTTEGFFQRGTLMLADDNPVGAAQQTARALELYPDVAQAERELFAEASAQMYLCGDRAERLFKEFLQKYPSSALRPVAQLCIADWLYDRGRWAEALKSYGEVDPNTLQPDLMEGCIYREAYCYLKTADYDHALHNYDFLAQRNGYSNKARFYQGYIAYIQGDYRKAAERFGAVNPRTGEPCAMTDYYLAQTYLMDGDYEQALQTARKALDKPVPMPQGWRTDFREEAEKFRGETQRVAGESLYALGRTDEALPYLREYVEGSREPAVSALYILGVEDYRQGEYDRALERLAPVSAQESAMGQSAYLYIGQCYLQQGNYQAATLALDKALRYDFDPAVQEAAYYNYAVARMQGGKVPFSNAVDVFEQFLSRYPNSSLAPQVEDYVISGYMNADNYSAALAAIDRIKKPSQSVLAARQGVVYMLGSRELQQGQAASALGHFREAAASKYGSKDIAVESRLWEGECLYKQGDYKGAVGAYQSFLKQATKKNANRALAYYDLGYAQFAQKQFADALKSFTTAVETAGQRGQEGFEKQQLADAYNRMADCRYYAHDFSGAAADYERALAENPMAGDYPMYQQGLMKGLRRDHAGKIATLSDMTRRFPSSALIPSALLEIGESYGELDQPDEAVKTYRRLADRFPSTAQGRQGLLLLAMTELNRGNRSEAVEAYKKVVVMYPTSEEARAAADDLRDVYTDTGRVADYVQFMRSVPNAPGIEMAEAAAMQLEAVERAMDQGRQQDAATLAQELISTYPDTPEAVKALATKADVEYRRGDTENALATYTELSQRASTGADVNAARLGIMRSARDLGENDRALEAAEQLLASSTLSGAQLSEAQFVKAMALRDLNRGAEAVALWEQLASNTDDLNGTKAAYYLAQYHHDKGDEPLALKEVNALIEANPPHEYWVARAFILLSDVRRSQGNAFEADEYLRSLRENYPGDNADIFRMIDERLNTK